MVKLASRGAQQQNRAQDEAPMPQPLANVDRIASWVSEYTSGIETDPLRDFTALRVGLDLTRANPNGKARLLSSGTAKLANLFSDPSMLTAAERDLGHVYAQMQTAQATYGFASINLAAGIAQWDGGARQMPVLLYPVTVERSDNERLSHARLRVWERAAFNLELVSALRERGVVFDPAKFIASCEYEDGAVNQELALQKIETIAARAIPDFLIERRFIIGCFVNSATMIARQATSVLRQLQAGPSGIAVIDAIAGDEKAARSLAPRKSEMQNAELDDDPHDEFEVGDVSNETRHAARLAANGRSVLVDAAADVSSARDALAIASRCVAQGKTVLYAPCVGSQKDEFLAAARETGIGPLVLDATDSDYAHAIDATLVDSLQGGSSKAITDFNRIADELVGVRARLARYFGDLHLTIQPWGVSAYQTIEELASIASLPTHPSNRVRLTASTARTLKDHLDDWGKKLVEAGKLGEFVIQPDDTPWYSASIFTESEADDAYRRVSRLADESLPVIRRQIAETSKACGFERPSTMEEWGRQVAALQNLRRTLDVFRPEIFQRDLPAMLDATLSKDARESSQVEMGYWDRRRYVKEIKSLLRPGTHVDDLHGALTVVARDVKQWKSMSSKDGWPTLPDGLDAIIETFESVTADLTALDSVLATTPEGPGLSGASFDTLESRLHRLRDDHQVLKNLPARSQLEREFKKVGLTELVKDLSARHVKPEAAPDELRLAWWTTVFDLIVHSSRMIANQDGDLLASTTERFVELDLRHIASIGPLLAKELSKRLAETLYSHSQEANQLHAQLSGDIVPSLATVLRDFPNLVHAAKPILVGAPANLAAGFGTSRLADVVIVDACSHAPNAEVLSVLSYAPASVIIADTDFTSSAAVSDAEKVLQKVRIPRAAMPANARLTEFLASQGHATDPIPPSALLAPSAEFHWVEAQGVPVHGSGLVESTAAEVTEVMELVRRHADRFADRPVPAKYRLSIVTLTVAHSSQIAEALTHLAVRNQAVAALLPQIRVADIANVAGLPAGDLILSTSFGKTAHGNLLQQFGQIEQDGGDRMLLNALSLAHGDCDIVSGFTAEDLDEKRLIHRGPKLLRSILKWAESLNDAPVALMAHSGARGELLTDLATRLQNAGYMTALNYGYSSGRKLPLAIGTQHGVYQLTVFTDDSRFMSIPSLRARHRFLPQALSKAGWYAVHVWSVGLFVDPDKEIEHILAQVPAFLRHPVRQQAAAGEPAAKAGLRQLFNEDSQKRSRQ
ncbi:MAG: helicase [Aeriscardovia sp.]|nr:helicase [Aeriscardovia sp.]